MKGVFEKYLLALRKTLLEEKTEHSDRTALETLLQTIADETETGILVQHEPKREADKGAPDFKVTKSGLHDGRGYWIARSSRAMTIGFA